MIKMRPEMGSAMKERYVAGDGKKKSFLLVEDRMGSDHLEGVDITLHPPPPPNYEGPQECHFALQYLAGNKDKNMRHSDRHMIPIELQHPTPSFNLK